MASPQSDPATIDQLADASASQFEALIEAFERAWQAGPTPNIDSYLQGDDSQRRALLVELAHADLEFRLKAGDTARVEAYLDRYPSLTHDSGAVLDLLEAEFELRRRTELDIALDEYQRRFPAYADDLGQRLRGTVIEADGFIRIRPTSNQEMPAVPGYQILQKIGRGGMGVIYQAKQARLKRLVALKFLPADLVQEQALLDRFVREAVTASALNHPNICTIHELGEHDGRPFIVMEFIDGQTLRAVAGGPLKLAEAAGLIRQAARALAAAHAAGVVHRDIKPENIMVRDDGYVKVVDFGLARRLPTLTQHDTQATHDTSPGALLGTVAYMSPEQTRGEPLEASSDVFSLGVVLYQLVTGRHPFESDSAFATLHAIASSHPASPSRLNPEIPTALEALIESMLNKDARLRPSAEAVQAALGPKASRPQAREPAAGGKNSIVHRAEELAALREALAEAEAGQLRLACVTGEPGIGKTTIVEDLLEDLSATPREYCVARGRCSERQAGTEAFLPAIEALASLSRSETTPGAAGLIKIVAPTWHAQLTRSLATAAGEAARASSQQAMLREFCNLLEEVSRLTPVVLFFDDVHWADASTVDLLAYLGRHSQRLRVLIVVTFRPTEMLLGPHPFHHVKLDLQAQGVCRELPLSFLNRQQLDDYLSLTFPGHDFPFEFAELIHARTEGSPLFMVDSLRYLRERGVIRQEAGRWSLARAAPDVQQDLPESVRGMIQRKLEQLEEEDRRLLGAAALQGFEFDSAVVAAAIHRDAEAVEERLQVLERVHGLVRLLGENEFPDRALTLRYGFVHILYQQALRAQIGPTRRAALSLALARDLERHYQRRSAGPAAEIACLFEVGREFGQAAHYFHLAAQNAAQVFAHRDAIALAQRGLRLLEGLQPSPARDELELPLQMTLGLHIQMTEGCAAEPAKLAYDRARELCPPSHDQALFTILWGLWLYFKVGSRLPRAQSVADELLALARKLNDPDLALQAHQALALTALCRGDLATALRHVEQVATLYDPTRHSGHAILFGQDPAVICKAFGAVALWLLGFPDTASRQSEEAIEMSRQLSPTSQAVALHFAAMLHQLCRDPAKTRQYAEASSAIAAEHGFSFWLAGSGVMSGWALCASGQPADGIRQLRQGLLDWDATGSVTYRTYYLGLLAEALASAGQIDDALCAVSDALALADQSDERFYEAELHRLRGELLLPLRSGKTGAAATSAEEAFQKAIAAARRHDAKSFQLRAAISLASLERRLGSSADSCHFLAQIYNSFTQGLATPDLVQARALIEGASRSN